MSDKIGLAIVTYVNNYGSFLQSYATQEAIEKLGFDTEVINTDGVKKMICRARKKYFLSRITNKSELKSYIVTIRGIVKKWTDRDYAEKISIRNEKFACFRDQTFSFSPPFDSWEKIGKYCRKTYRAVLVGSDQLWRPANIEGGYYTLKFVPEKVNKIAYATSFGVSKLPHKQAVKAREFLPGINYISVRENSGRKLVKNLTGREVPLVCDPVMLLTREEWEKHMKQRAVSHDYILCYFLGDNEENLRFAKEMKKKTGLSLVGIVHAAGYNKKAEEYFDEMPFDADPFEFISLIKYAEYVLTDSFHCSAFSIIFEKKFFAFRRFSDSDEMSTNDRLVTLFKLTGVTGRLISGYENITELAGRETDYKKVNDRLAKLRVYSAEYLKGALQNG